jgi:hypothetical protein
MNKNTIIAVVVIVIVVVGIAIFALGDHGTSPTQSQTQTATTTTTQTAQASTGSYTSSADGFSVNFPSTPEVSQTSFTSPSAGTIPLTKYTSQAATGANYVIYVYHYPGSYTFSSSYLSDAMQLFVSEVNTKYPGTKVQSQTQTEFLGNAAVSAVLSVPISGSNVTGYVLITTKDQNTYGFGTYGADQDAYNAFVNSFAYTQ